MKLQSKLSSATSIHLSGVEVEPSPYEPVIDVAKDDYGTTYSRLSQANYLCYLPLKKLNHLIDIFGGVGILTQCSHDGIEFTDSRWKKAIKLLQVDVDVGCRSKSQGEPNTNNGKQLSFKKLNYSKIIAKLEASELSVSEMNTCLGYLVLLLQVIGIQDSGPHYLANSCTMEAPQLSKTRTHCSSQSHIPHRTCCYLSKHFNILTLTSCRFSSISITSIP